MRKVLLYGLLGAGLAILPCYGAILSQTDWLKEPTVIAADYEEEYCEGCCEEEITVEAPADPEEDAPGQQVHTRDEEMVANWWEFEYVNDPDLPDELEEACYIYGEVFSICPEFLEAVSGKETGETYKEDLKDKSGKCWGPFQINVTAQKERIDAYGLTPEDMLTYDGGALIAASYIAELFDKYEDPAVVLMKYNGASTALKKYKKTGELNYYTRWVLNKSMELEEKHKALDEERTKG